MIITVELTIDTATNTATITDSTLIGAGHLSEIPRAQAVLELCRMITQQYGLMLAALASEELINGDTADFEEAIVASGVFDRIVHRCEKLAEWIRAGKNPATCPDVVMLEALVESVARDLSDQTLDGILRTPADANGYGSGTDVPTPEEVARLRAIFTKHPDGGN